MLNIYPRVCTILPLSQADLEITSGRMGWSAQSSFGNSGEPRPYCINQSVGQPPPNLLVKSWIDSSSRLKMVCRELMFPLCRIEHRYWETNSAHNSLNELIDLRGSLWNQASASPFKLVGNTLHSKRSPLALSIIA